NPHYQRDPVAAKTIAKNIVEGLERIDLPNRDYYEQRLADFDKRIDERLSEWTKELAPYKGAKLVTYHKSWEYFTGRFGFEGVGRARAHRAELITTMNAEGEKVIIREPFYPENLTRVVADKTGATVLTLPESPGGVPGTDDYFAFMEYIVKQVAGALAKAKGA